MEWTFKLINSFTCNHSHMLASCEEFQALVDYILLLLGQKAIAVILSVE